MLSILDLIVARVVRPVRLHSRSKIYITVAGGPDGCMREHILK